VASEATGVARGVNSGSGGTELGVRRTEQIGQRCAGEILRSQPKTRSFFPQLVGLRRRQFERQLHAGTGAAAPLPHKIGVHSDAWRSDRCHLTGAWRARQAHDSGERASEGFAPLDRRLTSLSSTGVIDFVSRNTICTRS
jgi:hypothetical protein